MKSRKHPSYRFFQLLALAIVSLPPALTGRSLDKPGVASDAATRARMNVIYGKLPLAFEANRGQIDSRAKFLSRGHGYTLFLTPDEAVLAAAHGGTLRVRLAGGNPRSQIEGLAELPGKSNYFIGNDPTKWRTNVPTYSKIRYRDVYPGIDLVYHGNQRQLEYDFVVARGADPRSIRIEFPGADAMEIDAQGDLVLRTAAGEIRQRKPVVYQEIEGIRQRIAGRYTILRKKQIGFRIARYDITKPLIIDPVLAYATYLGGNQFDAGRGIAVDSLGNAYVFGGTRSPDFPTTTGAFKTVKGGTLDAFVTKLNPTGSALVYSTFLGGGGQDAAYGIALDSSGNAHVTGTTESSDFPTVNAAQATSGGGPFDAFVTKLNPAGSALLYSTYLGGNNDDQGHGIAVDSLGSAYATGQTSSTNFLTTVGAFQTTFGGSADAFVTKLNLTGAVVYSTFLGGTGGEAATGIAVDSSGSVYVAGRTSSEDFPTTSGAFQTAFGGFGEDAFVAKLNPLGSALLYSTYLGGDTNDEANGIAVDFSGSAYVTGQTNSTNFPTANAVQATRGGEIDAFVTKLNPTGSALIYSTYLGGADIDAAFGIGLDDSGKAYVAGVTTSTDFPIINATQPTRNGSGDAFVTNLSATGSALLYSTYLGGSGRDLAFSVAVDASANAYVIGETTSSDFPVTSGAFQTSFGGGPTDEEVLPTDAFVVKLAQRPIELINDVGNTVNSFNLPQGTANSLQSKLNSALASLAGGNTTAACNQIDAFINEVQVQSGKKLTTIQANQLIAEAQQIKNSLGCP